MAEDKVGRTDTDDVSILQALGLLGAAVVDKRAVAAAEIHNPKPLRAAIVDQRVPPLGALIREREVVLVAAADGKSIRNRDAGAIVLFEPGFHVSIEPEQASDPCIVPARQSSGLDAVAPRRF